MTDLDLAALAEKAADEIDRRGWATGDLHVTPDLPPEERWLNYDPDLWHPSGSIHLGCTDFWGKTPMTEWPTLEPSPAFYQNGAVCALGGMRAAFDGKPTEGQTPDGNGYDTFVREFADWLEPEWLDRRGYSYDDAAGEWHADEGWVIDDFEGKVHEVVYGWNDSLFEKTDGDEDEDEAHAEAQAVVTGKLREFAKHWRANNANKDCA